MTENYQQPIVSRSFVDKITFILQYRRRHRNKPGGLTKKARQRLQTALEEGDCLSWYYPNNRYEMAVRFEHGGAEAKLQFGARNMNTTKGGVRVELNPSKWTAEGFEALHSFMRKIVGKHYDTLLTEPLINRIDVAVDVQNLSLSDVLIDCSHAQTLTVFGKQMKHGRVTETVMFGSFSSAYRTTVYDKRTHRLHEAVTEIAKTGLGKVKVAQVAKQIHALKAGPPVARVEIRGYKLRGLPLSQLLNESNRFERLNISSIDVLKSFSEPSRLSFVALCEQRGLKGALNAFESKRKLHKKLAKAVREPVPWWQPDDLWMQALLGLAEQGLFPAEAFEGGATLSVPKYQSY